MRAEDHSFFFTGPDVEQAIPYGICPITADTGWVNVGVDQITTPPLSPWPSIRRPWWQAWGRTDYPEATRLLITADAGGSNGYRTPAWKAELAAPAIETSLATTACLSRPAPLKRASDLVS